MSSTLGFDIYKDHGEETGGFHGVSYSVPLEFSFVLLLVLDGDFA